jgi:hypothetical protein
VSRLKMSGAIPLLLLYVFMVCTRTTLLRVLLLTHNLSPKKKMKINQPKSIKPKMRGLKLRSVIN